jgi:hypothetical protein
MGAKMTDVFLDPRFSDTKRIVYRLDAIAPIAVDDLASSLLSFSNAYQDYVRREEPYELESHAKLHIVRLTKGSIIAELAAIAAQGSLPIGPLGTIDSIKEAAGALNSVSGFIKQLSSIYDFFSGTTKSDIAPTKEQASRLSQLLRPVANDDAAQFNISIAGDVHVYPTITVNSEKANAVQNRVQKYLAPSLPETGIRKDVLLRLVQVRNDLRHHVGDLGVIESISKKSVKLWFTSETTKTSVIEQAYPFKMGYIVDVDIQTVNGEPKVYKILQVKHSFEI